MIPLRKLTSAFAFVCLLSQIALGAEEEKKETKKKEEPPKLSVTHGEVTIAGAPVKYTATAGKLQQKNDAGDTKAEIFFVAYTAGHQAKDQDEVKLNKADQLDTTRPVTFCFNGGPGSSSVWLHLGMLGPKRVSLPDDASRPRPPYGVMDNAYSLLDATDLVFIDPVSTGYSRPAKGEDKKQFHGYSEDLRSVGQFIHDYTTRYNRWGSPKFILGESYGGLRAAGLTGTLQGRYNMYLNGVVLVSAVVDFSTLRFSSNNDLPYVLFLPSYAATAYYHKALDDDLLAMPLEKVVARAEKFAAGPYATALLKGDALPDDARHKVVRQMARLTGLSEEYVDGANLRVSMSRYSKQLLRSRSLIVGRFDSRYTGRDPDTVGEQAGSDPSASAIDGIFTAGMNRYLRDHLKYEDQRVYEVISASVRPWNYGQFENSYVTAGPTLRDAIAANPHLQVFAACGYQDLATPQFALQHTRDHLMLAPEHRENFTTKYYEGGHMMYIYEPSLKKVRKDLLKFYEDSTP